MKVLDNNSVTVNNNTFIWNTIGINVVYGGTANVTNCIVAYDPEGSTSTGTGINRDSGTLNVSYSDVYGNATDYSGTISNGVGTISANAKFTNSAGNDYTLQQL